MFVSPRHFLLGFAAYLVPFGFACFFLPEVIARLHGFPSATAMNDEGTVLVMRSYGLCLFGAGVAYYALSHNPSRDTLRALLYGHSVIAAALVYLLQIAPKAAYMAGVAYLIMHLCAAALLYVWTSMPSTGHRASSPAKKSPGRPRKST